MKLEYEEGIKVVFRCDHPEIENNTCPIRSGECSECPYCTATMAAKDLFQLTRKEEKNETCRSYI